ncbi:AAA family ATPase [Corynebacterium sp. 3HC-13]|nr:AAA family ATPase [Corynebacterium poyangense]
MLVSFIQTKGGVGKTTSSILIACGLKQLSRDVVVYDADPQQSAKAWADLAQQRDESLPFPVHSISYKEISYLAHDETYRLVDTPPGNVAVIQEAINASDFLIIPSSPSPADLQRLGYTLNTIPDGKNIGVLLNFTQHNTRIFKETRALLENSDIPTFSCCIPQTVSLREVFGTCPKKDALYGYREVAEELTNLESMEG